MTRAQRKRFFNACLVEAFGYQLRQFESSRLIALGQRIEQAGIYQREACPDPTPNESREILKSHKKLVDTFREYGKLATGVYAAAICSVCAEYLDSLPAGAPAELVDEWQTIEGLCWDVYTTIDKKAKDIDAMNEGEQICKTVMKTMA